MKKRIESWTNLLGGYCVLIAALLLLALPAGYRLPLPGPQGKAPTPPAPPVIETFQGAPQLALFPRLGTFRPEAGDDYLPFWKIYRKHLLRISGVVQTDAISGNKAFSFRAISGIDSVGHFAPLAVQPNTRYRVRFRLNTNLAEDGTAGVGISEYKEFRWIPEQYPESLHKELFVNSRELLRLARTDGWQQFDFSFTTSPQTRMIHLNFFREGDTSDRAQVLIDDISVLAE